MRAQCSIEGWLFPPTPGAWDYSSGGQRYDTIPQDNAKCIKTGLINKGPCEARPFVDEAIFCTFSLFFAHFSEKSVLIVSYSYFRKKSACGTISGAETG